MYVVFVVGVFVVINVLMFTLVNLLSFLSKVVCYLRFGWFTLTQVIKTIAIVELSCLRFKLLLLLHICYLCCMKQSP